MEWKIRIESVNKDNSHSWVRISHGLNKLVTDLSNKEYDDNEQETSEMKSEEFALKTNVLASASRSNSKAKPRRRTSACSSARTVPICERSWTDIEPETYSSIAYPVSKRLSTLLRHGDLPREEDGAIEFWRLKDYLRNEFEYSQHWSDEMWKSNMAGGGGNNKRFQYCTDPSGQEILYIRALQGHSGRNPIDPTLLSLDFFFRTRTEPCSSILVSECVRVMEVFFERPGKSHNSELCRSHGQQTSGWRRCQKLVTWMLKL